MIKKSTKGYDVYDHTGKKHLGGPYKTKKEAVERIRQVEGHKLHDKQRDGGGGQSRPDV